MGGSSDGFLPRDFNINDFNKKLQNSGDEVENEAYCTNVNGLIRDALLDINDRDTDAVNTHLDTIKKAIEKEIDGTIDLRYGGSVAKHTYVDGLSDIDSLALLNKSELAGMTPDQVKDYFCKRLQERLPDTEIKKGALAVTIKYSDGHEVQILPAIKTATGIKISNASGEWSNVVKPETFAKSLRAVNQRMSGKLIPAIKLVKSIMSDVPESRKLKGYHTEALAIEVFKNYSGEKTPKEMVKHFFNTASEKVLSPIKDKTGQSTHVDSYLGNKNSLSRQMCADAIQKVSRKIKRADTSNNSQIWEELL